MYVAGAIGPTGGTILQTLEQPSQEAVSNGSQETLPAEGPDGPMRFVRMCCLLPAQSR